LQEDSDVALFFADVRTLASEKTTNRRKPMKRFLVIGILTCVVSLRALAGDIPTDGFTSPPATTTTTSMSPSGGLVTGADHESEMTSALIELMVALLV
jgi:hypothetical protein